MKLGNKIGGFFGLIFMFIIGIFKKLFYLLETFLFIRLALKFISANPGALVVDWIYHWSGKIVAPFDYIFHDIILTSGYFIETSTLAAMIGYAILAFIVLKIFKAI